MIKKILSIAIISLLLTSCQMVKKNEDSSSVPEVTGAIDLNAEDPMEATTEDSSVTEPVKDNNFTDTVSTSIGGFTYSISGVRTRLIADEHQSYTMLNGAVVQADIVQLPTKITGVEFNSYLAEKWQTTIQVTDLHEIAKPVPMVIVDYMYGEETEVHEITEIYIESDKQVLISITGTDDDARAQIAQQIAMKGEKP